MVEFAFTPAAVPSLPIAGTTTWFPIRRIFCVGRNYADHAREMGHDPDREPPFFFDKPADAIVAGNAEIPFPSMTSRLEHEVELVVAIGKAGRNVSVEGALDLVWGYAIGNDLTRRDLQAKAKKQGRPWTMAKGFDASAVCGPLHRLADVGHLSGGKITLSVNSVLRQQGDLADMIWSVPEVISALSEFVELQPGDLIYSGTPAGVGPLQPNDIVHCSIEGLGEITNRISN